VGTGGALDVGKGEGAAVGAIGGDAGAGVGGPGALGVVGEGVGGSPGVWSPQQANWYFDGAASAVQISTPNLRGKRRTPKPATRRHDFVIGHRTSAAAT